MSDNRGGIKSALKKASIEMLLLSLLSEGDRYGYELTQALRRRSDGEYSILEGSMYPILYRLSDQGYVESYEKSSGVRMVRVYYHLTDAGWDYLKTVNEEYDHNLAVIQQLRNSIQEQETTR